MTTACSGSPSKLNVASPVLPARFGGGAAAGGGVQRLVEVRVARSLVLQGVRAFGDGHVGQRAQRTVEAAPRIGAEDHREDRNHHARRRQPEQGDLPAGQRHHQGDMPQGLADTRFIRAHDRIRRHPGQQRQADGHQGNHDKGVESVACNQHDQCNDGNGSVCQQPEAR